MLPTLAAFFSSTGNPCAWLDQSSGLDPQAQRTNLVLWDAWDEIVKQFITEDVFQPFVEVVVSCMYLLAYINWNNVREK